MTNVNSYTQAWAQDQADPAFLDQLAAGLGGAAAPNIAQYEAATAQEEAQAGVAPAGLQEQILNQGQTTGYDLASALLGYQGTQLQEQGLASQIGTAAQQQQIEQRQYGVSQKQLGLQEQGTALSQANLAYQTPLQYQKQGSAAAQSGATNSQGNKQATGAIQQQAAYQGSQLGIQAQNEFLQGQLNQLGQQSEQVGYAGQQAGYSNQMQQLQLAAKQAGIPVQQLISQLQYGIGQSGISADPTQLMTQASGNESQASQASSAVLANAGAITGVGAQWSTPGNPEMQSATERAH